MNLSEFPPGGWAFEDADGWTLRAAHLDFNGAAGAIIAHRLGSPALRSRAGLVDVRRDLLEFTERRLPGRYGDAATRDRLVASTMSNRGGGCAGCGR
jgi:hypothetical protein